ncbi:YqkE family protein [Paenibacillus agricola]|uniref:YqkE family protein n=1 Tax=Paenibacillus agricola TaxID=2716264 RepID=A0ABX0IYA8_9BACL|nr:YqkE family protein [Paenibacillus agricola]NHN28940.1 YqkE family protein [Paenibacillus agricola]
MSKRNRPTTTVRPKSAAEDKPATLKDLLNPEIVQKLKAQSDEMKAAENKQREDVLKQAADARKAEQKRLENDFEYLLNNSTLKMRKD